MQVTVFVYIWTQMYTNTPKNDTVMTPVDTEVCVYAHILPMKVQSWSQETEGLIVPLPDLKTSPFLWSIQSAIFIVNDLK